MTTRKPQRGRPRIVSDEAIYLRWKRAGSGSPAKFIKQRRRTQPKPLPYAGSYK